MITILTPTYNRGLLLKKIYKSLLNQECLDFEWLIIDDGSTDDTNKIINNFIKENKFKIKYYYKQYGGKHTAVNLGVTKAEGDLVLILDSDDILTPSAIKLVKEKWIYDDNEDISGLSFARNIKDVKKYEFATTPYIDSIINVRYNQGVLIDRLDIFKTSILKENPFPVFKNENFLSEAVVFAKLGFKYKTVYFNNIISKRQYLSDGLTKKSRILRIKNPKGAVANYRVLLNKQICLKRRIRYAILYNIFSFFDKKLILNTDSNLLIILTFIPSYFIYLYWHSKED